MSTPDQPGTEADLLARLSAAMPDPDTSAREAAEARWGTLATPPGALGRLEQVGAWVCAVQGRCPPLPLVDVRVVVMAGDHGIAASGVSASPRSLTAATVRAIVAGGAVVNVLAHQVGAAVTVLDLSVDDDLDDLGPAVGRHKVRRGTEPMDVADPMSPAQSLQAFQAGRAVADDAVDSGAQLLVLGDVGVASTTPASTLVALLTRSEVVDVVGRGSGIDDEAWMRKAAAIRDAMFRAKPRLADPIDLLAATTGPDIAAMAGFVTQAAVRRTPVVLDGLVSCSAALVAQRISFRAPRWYLAGHRSTEPAHALALDRLGLTPLLDVSVRLGEGTGALLAVPLVQAASRLLADVSARSDVLPPA